MLNWGRALAIEQKMSFILSEMEQYGFLVDWELILTHINELNIKIEEIDKEVIPQLPRRAVPKIKKKDGIFPWVKEPYLLSGDYRKVVKVWYPDEDPEDRLIGGPFTKVTFERLDIGSSAQVKDFLLAQGWIPDKWNFKKVDGKTTNERTSPKLSQEDKFLGVKGSVGNLVAKRIQLRHRRSQLEGWLKCIRADDRIGQGISGITPTGRLKHTKIVNIPGAKAYFGNEMRSVFIAPEGYKIVGCDAASCQLRMLAHYMGDDAYIKTIESGKEEDGTDPHTVNMNFAGLATRDEAKTFIYAFLFGSGNPNLGALLGTTARNAGKVKARFKKNLPALDRLLNGITTAWKRRGYLIGLDGRKIWVRSEHMLLVYLLQCAEAVVMKVATCIAYDRIKRRGLRSRLVAHVHDEFQWETKDEDCEEVSEILEQSIRDAYTHFKLNVKGDGTSKVGQDWSCTH